MYKITIEKNDSTINIFNAVLWASKTKACRESIIVSNKLVLCINQPVAIYGIGLVKPSGDKIVIETDDENTTLAFIKKSLDDYMLRT